MESNLLKKVNKTYLSFILFLPVLIAICCLSAKIVKSEDKKPNLTKSYYEDFKRECGEDQCCLSSVYIAEFHNSLIFKNPSEAKCPFGYKVSTSKCETGHSWCQKSEDSAIFENGQNPYGLYIIQFLILFAFEFAVIFLFLFIFYNKYQSIASKSLKALFLALIISIASQAGSILGEIAGVILYLVSLFAIRGVLKYSFVGSFFFLLMIGAVNAFVALVIFQLFITN